ncbi:MAG: acyl carrier protein [Clostridia bacterium]|nr:acyl carrier protein [Clostridia bacterium]
MTFEKVKTLISQQLKVPEEKVVPDARLVEDLGADSANVMVLIMEVEDQFGIMVEDDAIMTLKTVQDVVEYIDSRIQA